MLNDVNTKSFFLGANTPVGFVSRFEQLGNYKEGTHTFIVKGGPGTGKSSFMKKIAQHYINKHENVELIYCSSDPASLDGVILSDRNVSIADGTAPHIIEPSVVGACEHIISINNFWNEKRLIQNKISITALTEENSDLHRRASRFLSAAGSILNDTAKIAEKCCLDDKLISFIERLIAKYAKNSLSGKGRESIRFIGAITPIGVISFTSTIENICDNIFVLNDDCHIGKKFFSILRDKLLENRFDIISSYCPIAPYEKIEYILIPEIRTAFVTSNKFHTHNFPNAKIINSNRFVDLPKFKLYKQRLKFNNDVAHGLIDQSIALLAEAKAIHDQLEKFYMQAMDFSALDHKLAEIISLIDFISAS